MAHIRKNSKESRYITLISGAQGRFVENGGLSSPENSSNIYTSKIERSGKQNLKFLEYGNLTKPPKLKNKEDKVGQERKDEFFNQYSEALFIILNRRLHCLFRS